MKRILIIGVIAVLLGCNDQRGNSNNSNATDVSEDPKTTMERLEAGNLSAEDVKLVTDAFPGMTDACIESVRRNGVDEMFGTADRRVDQCFQMTPRQRWRGLWAAGFEQSKFCPQPAKACPDDGRDEDIWLEMGEGVASPHNFSTERPGVYAITFDGRRTLKKAHFGHFGMSDYEMVVDRVISVRRITTE